MTFSRGILLIIWILFLIFSLTSREVPDPFCIFSKELCYNQRTPMEKTAKITFCGGTGSVTGSNFLLEADGKKILIDCGLTQGIKLADDINWDPFPYDSKAIDILFITHAHVDHLVRVPKLIAEGFRGQIFSTPPTRALASPMLEDTMNILVKNKGFRLDEIYTPENIKIAHGLWRGFDYHEKIQITDRLEASFKNAGHILGSAMVEFTVGPPRSGGGKKKKIFTRGLGERSSPPLPGPAGGA